MHRCSVMDLFTFVFSSLFCETSVVFWGFWFLFSLFFPTITSKYKCVHKVYEASLGFLLTSNVMGQFPAKIELRAFEGQSK